MDLPGLIEGTADGKGVGDDFRDGILDELQKLNPEVTYCSIIDDEAIERVKGLILLSAVLE